MTKEDFSDTRLGLFLRQSVQSLDQDRICYGQVTAYDRDQVTIAYGDTISTVVVDRIVQQVYPIIVIFFGSCEWSNDIWAVESLDNLHDQLLDRLFQNNNEETLSKCMLSELWMMTEINATVNLADDSSIEWISPKFGNVNQVDIQHVNIFVRYLDGNKKLFQRSWEDKSGLSSALRRLKSLQQQARLSLSRVVKSSQQVATKPTQNPWRVWPSESIARG